MKKPISFPFFLAMYVIIIIWLGVLVASGAVQIARHCNIIK